LNHVEALSYDKGTVDWQCSRNY